MSTPLSGKPAARLAKLLPVLWLATGCWSHAAAPPAETPSFPGPLVAAERERTRAAERRAARLEEQLRTLEARAHADTLSAQQRSAEKLDRLFAAQERLETQVAKLEASQRTTPTPAVKPVPPCATAAALASDSNRMEEYFLDLLERAQIDAPSWRGGLSREKREALRILLRPERQLDSRNPLEL